MKKRIERMEEHKALLWTPEQERKERQEESRLSILDGLTGDRKMEAIQVLKRLTVQLYPY